MKILLLIRHAKSSWENFAVPDIDRPLNDRGMKNAPDMAERVKKKDIAIDAFLSSPAKRAITTARLFVEVYGQNQQIITEVPRLYEANNEAFLETIRSAPEDAQTIAVFSHNPGISEFANTLCSAHIDEMPTCAVFAVRCQIDKWSAFEQKKNQFYFFDFPRNR